MVFVVKREKADKSLEVLSTDHAGESSECVDCVPKKRNTPKGSKLLITLQVSDDMGLGEIAPL